MGVSFREAGKVFYYETGPLEVAPGDAVVVETARGLEMGDVVAAPEGLSPEAAGTPPRVLLRRAEEEDLEVHFRNRLRAAEALQLAREKARSHGLPMKMLDAEFTLDGNKVVLYFAAEGRVDFRGLVRDLASGLRKRIELHQVGPRDRSALSGGLGPCGRECCCSSWIREFTPVSIKMAKEQGLSLNPTKISGSCGRLMCCLRYEYHAYRELRREMPKPGAEMVLPEGRVTVVAVHLARYTLTVEHPELGLFEVPAGRARELEEAALCVSCTSPRAEICEAPEAKAPAAGPSATQGDGAREGGRRPRREKAGSREGGAQPPDARGPGPGPRPSAEGEAPSPPGERRTGRSGRGPRKDRAAGEERAGRPEGAEEPAGPGREKEAPRSKGRGRRRGRGGQPGVGGSAAQEPSEGQAPDRGGSGEQAGQAGSGGRRRRRGGRPRPPREPRAD